MAHDIIILVLGLVFIIVGGNMLTDGAEAVARRFRISPTVIGMTVVAIGSSAPDFVVALTGTLQGHSQLAVGDVVGANVFDLLLVVGLLALIGPVWMSAKMATKDLALLAISGLALLFCADDVLIDGSATNFISRSDGLLLLCFFAIFMGYTLSMSHDAPVVVPAVRRTRFVEWVGNVANMVSSDAARLENRIGLHPHTAGAPNGCKARPAMGILQSCIYIAIGLTLLVIGGNWIVDGGSGVALRAGMSEAMVGLTIVALGSSAPDLATSVAAAVKNQPGIALGNIVGSCIFNVFLIIGFCASVEPLYPGGVSLTDYLTLAGAGIMLYVMANVRKRHVLTRCDGVILVAAYAAYMAYLIVSA